MDKRLFDALAIRLSRPISRRGAVRSAGKAVLGAVVYAAFNQTPGWAATDRRRHGCTCSGNPLPPNGACDCHCNVDWPGPPAADLCNADTAGKVELDTSSPPGDCVGNPPGCAGTRCRRRIRWACVAAGAGFVWTALHGVDTCPNADQTTAAQGTCQPATQVCNGSCVTTSTWVCTGYPIAEQWHEVKRRRTDTCPHGKRNHNK
jgi:hypothetical protein